MLTKNDYLIIAVFLCFFIYTFLVFESNFKGPDEPIYFAYTASIAEDGDLNVANQIPPHYSYYREMGISKTYNIPDFHGHGGVILWWPFYFYAKVIYHIAHRFILASLNIYNFDIIAKCAMSFSTVMFGFFTVFLTFLLCRVFFSTAVALWSVFAIFLGTPFFYYLVVEVGNANILACLFSIISLWFCSHALGRKGRDWLLYGLFFSVCLTVKIDLWFQLFFILILFVFLVRLKQAVWFNGVYFIIGLIPGIVLKSINDYIKYGTLHLGEFGLLNLKDYYLFWQLFSPHRGYLYTSPILCICLFGYVFVIIRLLRNIKYLSEEESMRDVFLAIIGTYLIAKILIIGYSYAWGGGTYGARPLLSEFPAFALLYARVIGHSKRWRAAVIVIIVSFLMIIWNIIIILKNKIESNLYHVGIIPSANDILASDSIISVLFNPKDINLKLKFLLPLFLVGAGSIILIIMCQKQIKPDFWHRRAQDYLRPWGIFPLFTIYLCTAYGIITLLNINNNKNNAKELARKGFFANVQIVEPREFERIENVGSANEMISYFERIGNKRRAEKIKKYIKEIYYADR